MKRNRLLFAGLHVLAFFASGCADDLGACEGSLQGRDTVLVNNTVVYGGQAIMNRACATGCHASGASGADRRGVPAGLDFDLLPIDEGEAAGTRKVGTATIVKLKSSQIEGLRARQKKIVEHRSLIWQQVQDGLMPPTGMFDAVMNNIIASSEKAPCTEGKPYSKLPVAQTREVLRNWLACGAPLVETNGSKVDKTRVAGAAGYQYPVCKKAPDAVITLESLFKTTLSECGGCHDGGSLSSPPEFLSLTSLAKSLRTKSVCGKKPFVTPGNPDKSYLLDLLEGPNPECNHEQMPKGGLGPLSARAIAEVSAWIEAGAPTTADDIDEPEASDEESASDEGEQSTEPEDEQAEEDAAVPELEEELDAGPVKDAGVVKDAGSDAGKDAGRDAGKDAGRDAGR